MNLFESFETLLEARETSEKIKDAELYKAIAPERARSEGTKKRKEDSLSDAKKKGINIADVKSLSAQIEKIKIGGGMKVQRHISLPAAVYLVSKKKKLSNDFIETITKAQKDYFYKSFPKLEKSEGQISKQIISLVGSRNDYDTREIAFVNFYRDTINKILKATSFSDIQELSGFEDDDVPEDKKSQYLARLKSNVKSFKDNEILDKIRFWKNDLKKLASIKEVEPLARKAVFDDEYGIYKTLKGLKETTANTIKGRKEEKREAAREKKRSGAELSPEEEKRALGGKGEREERFKKKFKEIKEMFKRANEIRDVVYSLYDVSGKDLPEGTKTLEQSVQKELKELLKRAGFKWGRDTAEGMMWNLQRRIEKNKKLKETPEEKEKREKKQEVDLIKAKAKEKAYEASLRELEELVKRDAELRELKELMEESYDEKTRLIQKALNEVK